MSDSPDRLVATVRTRLAAEADPVRGEQAQAYLKSTMPLHGMPMATLRRTCRQVFDEHPLPDEQSWRHAVLELWDAARFREERYAAIELTGHRLYRLHQRPAALELYRHLVATGAWWDLVDPVASNRVGPILRAFPAEVTPVVLAWATDDDLWVRRTSLICQLGSGADTDLDLLRHAVVSNLEGTRFGSEFFIRKAIGWALRQHARTDPDQVRASVAEHADRLSGLSRREALKHVGEQT